MIYISNYPFARNNTAPLTILESAGLAWRKNDSGRKLTPEELRAEAVGAVGLIAGTEDLEPLVDASETLRFISRVGIGLDNVPLRKCREKNILVSYTPDAVTAAVAEFTIGLMLNLTRHITPADRDLRSGIWNRPYGRRLGEMKVGIIGFGRVGGMVADLLLSFHPTAVLYHDIADRSANEKRLRENGLPIRKVSREELLSESDLITLHVPRNSSTKNMVDADFLRAMKKDAFLINTSRGGTVEETALAAALDSGEIAGAALDVFEHEPYRGELVASERVLLTQHMGSCSHDCRERMESEAAEAIADFFSRRQPRQLVPEQEYTDSDR